MNKELTQRICGKLRKLYVESGNTQTEIGDKLRAANPDKQYPQPLLSAWFSGQSTSKMPPLDDLILLASIFNVSLDELVGMDEIENKREFKVRDIIKALFILEQYADLSSAPSPGNSPEPFLNLMFYDPLLVDFGNSWRIAKYAFNMACRGIDDKNYSIMYNSWKLAVLQEEKYNLTLEKKVPTGHRKPKYLE